ncbi:MAG: Gfo/Idh/MocA family oxidoreductase [Gemmatimonadetes bacterium]|nr:Gfo/Idh/MocA family oxidoreductase [Gemmatimonadota bacterium]MYG15433.1 Gfo/Idh/MocA family oxidoreductase [Gemmatimonadota bacterium]
MATKIGIGIIGMGWMGMVHGRAYHQVRQRFPESGLIPELVVCADDVSNRCEQARNMLGFTKTTTDWREVMDDPDVSVVNITAPNHLHLDMVRTAAAAGKHIFCEKPVGRSPAETAEIARAAAEAGVLTWVGYNYRWAPLVQHTRSLIADGILGDITHYRGRFFAGYASHPDGVLSWRFRREDAGSGTLGDLMSHVTDMAHLLAGPIRRVVGQKALLIEDRPVAPAGEGTHFSVGTGGQREPVTNEDYAGALVEFENGAMGTFEVDRVIQGTKCQMAFEIHGTKGAVRWDFERMNELQLYTVDGPHDGFVTLQSGPAHPGHVHFNPGPAVGLGYDDLKAIETFHFLQTIAAGRQGEPGFSEARAVAEVLAAVERSWSSDRWETVQEIG